MTFSSRNEGEAPDSVLGIDPGRSKCGLAVVESSAKTVRMRRVVATERLAAEIASILREYKGVGRIVIGNGTQSVTLRKAISDMFPRIPIFVVEEHGSSLRARDIYLRENPARGWKKLLPNSLRTPEKPIDDIVAEILIKEFLEFR